MVKFVFIFMLLFTSSVMAQVSDDALANIESRIDKFEDLLKTLTSEMEENGHNQKRESGRVEGLVKELDLSVKELKNSLSGYENRVKMLETSNELLIKRLDSIEQDISRIDNFTKTIPTKEPLSLVESKAKSSPAVVSLKLEDELLVLNKEKEAKRENSTVAVAEYDEYKQALSFYNDKSYTESAIRFAEFIKKYPEGKHFYPALLYLGLSMSELNKINNSCQVFANIINSKEEVDSKVKFRANTEFDKLNCKNLNNRDGK